MRTMVAFLDMTAQGGSAADADVTESFPLLWGDGVSPLLQEFLSMFAKDIGHFEPMFSHRSGGTVLAARTRSSEPSISSGLRVERMAVSER